MKKFTELCEAIIYKSGPDFNRSYKDERELSNKEFKDMLSPLVWKSVSVAKPVQRGELELTAFESEGKERFRAKLYLYADEGKLGLSIAKRDSARNWWVPMYEIQTNQIEKDLLQKLRKIENAQFRTFDPALSQEAVNLLDGSEQLEDVKKTFKKFAIGIKI